MRAVDVRSELVRALRLDAIGPDPGEPEATEALPQSPSEWYLTGFLVPYQAKAEDRQDPTSNEGVDEGGAATGGDDPQDREKPSARRAFLPSSLGLSVLVPKNAGSVRATVTWGDYRLVNLPTVRQSGHRSPAIESLRRALRRRRLACRRSPPRALLRPQGAVGCFGAKGHPARQVYRRGRPSVLRDVGQLHRGRPGTEHRGRRPPRRSGLRSGAALAVRCPRYRGQVRRLPGLP